MRPLIRLLERLDAFRRAKLFVTAKEYAEREKAIQELYEASREQKARFEEAMEGLQKEGAALKEFLDRLTKIDQDALGAHGNAPPRVRLMLEIPEHVIDAATKDQQVAQVLVGQAANTVAQQVTLLIQQGGVKRIVTPAPGLIIAQR